MPIDYKKYHKDWFTVIRPAILSRANNQCECCGLENKTKGIRDLDGTFYNIEYIMSELENKGIDLFYNVLKGTLTKDGKAKVIKIVLTIAHLDHDITNNDYNNLKAMCQKCHLNYDKEHHKKSRKRNKGIIELF